MVITKSTVTIAGFTLYWYGVAIFLGVLAALFCALRREKKLNLPKDTAWDVLLVCVPAGIVGARAYFVAFHADLFHSLKEILSLRDGGLAVYGGVLLGAAGLFIYARRKRLPFGALTDLAVPCLALGQAAGRWGNFFNEEAYGIAVTNPTLQCFPFAVYIEKTASWQFAAFFWESVWCFLIFFVLYFGRRKKTGMDTLWYLVLYAFERCALESLRTDSLTVGPVRVSQLLSAAVLTVILLVLLVKMRPGWYFVLPACAAGAVCLLGTLTVLPQIFVFVSLPVLLAGNGYLLLKVPKEPKTAE